MFKRKILLVTVLVIAFMVTANAQEPISSNGPRINYENPEEYEIGGITVSGINYLDHNVLIQISGLSVGDTIKVPGEETEDAIRMLWKQGLFSDVKITATKTIRDKIFLNIHLKEQPRLSKFSFSGMKKSEVDDVREKIKLVKGAQVTENLLNTIDNKIKAYFVDKGFLNVKADIIQEVDTNLINNVILNINVAKGEKVKIEAIIIEGNDVTATAEAQNNKGFKKIIAKITGPPFSDRKLRRAMKETKQKTWYNLFKTSKFLDFEYDEDKKKIIAKYNEKGYRDAKIIKDTIYKYDEKSIVIKLDIYEGSKYYFRNITWVGNSKYSSKFLSNILGIEKGDIYNQSRFEEELFYAPNGVTSLYQDDGYLFFSVMPVEVLIENDSIDIEMRIREGKQARINRVTIIGNNKTNEHVIRREIRTKPGWLYNRSDVQRTIRELAQLGYFDPEKLNVDFNPDPQNGTVDLEYTLEEKPSDQFELSGGWGARMIVGSIGLSFTNFSARKMFKPKAWKPIPTGDGQRLSIRVQSNGLWYQSYNLSFVEPWLGGKKPNSLSVSFYHSVLSNGESKKIEDENGDKVGNPDRTSMNITGMAVGFGKRLKWPDDFFTLYAEASYQHYWLDDYDYMNLFSFNNGHSNNLSFSATIARKSSGPNPIYPVMGSDISFLGETTPFLKLFRDDRFWELSDEDKQGLSPEDILKKEDQNKYLWIDYYKFSFKSLTYTTLKTFGKNNYAFVLHTRFEFGYIGFYDKLIGPSPFEGYQVGGDGLMTYNVYGKETIPLRGYDNGALTPTNSETGKQSGNIYEKFTLELRVPLSLNPSATLYALAFAEAGNAWYSFKDFNAFDVKRSAGIGVRIFLPMFGKLGVDWGYGFDTPANSTERSGSQFHFIIGQNF